MLAHRSIEHYEPDIGERVLKYLEKELGRRRMREIVSDHLQETADALEKLIAQAVAIARRRRAVLTIHEVDVAYRKLRCTIWPLC